MKEEIDILVYMKRNFHTCYVILQVLGRFISLCSHLKVIRVTEVDLCQNFNPSSFILPTASFLLLPDSIFSDIDFNIIKCHLE